MLYAQDFSNDCKSFFCQLLLPLISVWVRLFALWASKLIYKTCLCTLITHSHLFKNIMINLPKTKLFFLRKHALSILTFKKYFKRVEIPCPSENRTKVFLYRYLQRRHIIIITLFYFCFLQKRRNTL